MAEDKRYWMVRKRTDDPREFLKVAGYEIDNAEWGADNAASSDKGEDVYVVKGGEIYFRDNHGDSICVGRVFGESGEREVLVYLNNAGRSLDYAVDLAEALRENGFVFDYEPSVDVAKRTLADKIEQERKMLRESELEMGKLESLAQFPPTA